MMPKIPTYTLAWLPAQVAYQLYRTLNQEAIAVTLDSPSWFRWLNEVSSFAFAGKQGHYTARKETRSRGEHYWYAYLVRNNHLSKKYLGKTTAMTLARLETVASEFAGSSRDDPDASPIHAQAPRARAISTNGSSGEIAPAPHTSLHPLLMTKLHIPRPRAQLVTRRHLITQLQQSVQRSLTLLSAPAGFGKTTLLAQWLQESKQAVAWLSLEVDDNDPARFLPYVIAAFQTINPQLGKMALELLRTPQPPAPETVLTLLLNDLLKYQHEDIVLVLDDYHVITNETLQRGMNYLLDHLPSHLHLILSSRTDPPLPLARLRANGQFAEIRVSNLRFAGDEIRTFLQTIMGLMLPAEAIQVLEQRTEGWIAGLQLAALSLQGEADRTRFLEDFTGTHRFILDYLSEEVLTRQSPEIQEFLLHTSLLERLSGSLCDAITEQRGSQNILQWLEKANLFVVALDEVRGWYRYHHLFAEALRSHLHMRQPTMVPILHQRASTWYEHHNLPLEAIHHALAIPDENRAIRLIEPIIIPFAFQGQRSLVLKWLSTLQKSVIRAHPLLCVHYASLLMLTNQFENARTWQLEAEAGINTETPPLHIQIVQGYISTNRSTMAIFSGDLFHAIPFAQQALHFLPETEQLARAGNYANLAHAYQVSGDASPATEQRTQELVALIRTFHNSFATVSSIAVLAHLYVLQGQLRQAATTYAQIMQIASSPERLEATFSGPYYYFGLGSLFQEWNQLEEAEQHLLQGITLIHNELPLEAWVAIQGYTALAYIHHTHGNTQATDADLDKLDQLARQRHFTTSQLTQIAAIRARIELMQGNFATAERWANNSGLSPNDPELHYLREYEYLVLARVAIAQQKQSPATSSLRTVLQLLERLQEAANEKSRRGSLFEILKIRVLALEALGDQAAALATLEHLLQMTEQEGYIRFFVNEGPVMFTLLNALKARSAFAKYITILLQAFQEAPPQEHEPQTIQATSLPEPLTEREREVLQLLLKGASNREIAQQLVLSINTVKRHVYNLCGKLGVQSRMQAISRARLFHLV